MLDDGDVDVPAAAGLVAVDGQDVVAGPHRNPAEIRGFFMPKKRTGDGRAEGLPPSRTSLL